MKMHDLIEFYKEQAENRQLQLPWLRRLHEEAIVDFERLQIPTRSDEEWKYTTLELFAQQKFTRANALQLNMPTIDVPIGIHITIANGQVVGLDELAAQLPSGVIIESLAQAIINHPDKIQAVLGRALTVSHGLQALNTAMLQCGLFIYLPEQLQLTTPVVVTHWQDVSNQAVYVRHLVLAESGSAMSLIEDYRGASDCVYFTNTVTEIMAASHSQVTHIKLQRESESAYHIGCLAVEQGRHSAVQSHVLSLGSQLARSDTNIRLAGEYAACVINGIYVAANSQHLDHHTSVLHNVPNCQSMQDYKGILTGHARAVFNGKIIVAHDASHTDALQYNKNLLLSKSAEVDTKPQLEIFTDDINCKHGATVGCLDEDALFYLATRGIDHAEAMRYLIDAFMIDNWSYITELSLVAWLQSIFNQKMAVI